MNKELKNGNLRVIAETVLSQWDNYKKDLKLNAKSLYNLIGLKKVFVEKGQQINDTLVQLFESNDCPMNAEQTGFMIPNEKRDEMEAKVNELYDQDVTITYEPIIVGEDDQMPTDLMDVLFDFIEFK